MVCKVYVLTLRQRFTTQCFAKTSFAARGSKRTGESFIFVTINVYILVAVFELDKDASLSLVPNKMHHWILIKFVC